MLVIGVRSSWLTLETKVSLSWSTSRSRSTEARSRGQRELQRPLGGHPLGDVLGGGDVAGRAVPCASVTRDRFMKWMRVCAVLADELDLEPAAAGVGQRLHHARVVVRGRPSTDAEPRDLLRPVERRTAAARGPPRARSRAAAAAPGFNSVIRPGLVGADDRDPAGAVDDAAHGVGLARRPGGRGRAGSPPPARTGSALSTQVRTNRCVMLSTHSGWSAASRATAPPWPSTTEVSAPTATNSTPNRVSRNGSRIAAQPSAGMAPSSAARRPCRGR